MPNKNRRIVRRPLHSLSETKTIVSARPRDVFDPVDDQTPIQCSLRMPNRFAEVVATAAGQIDAIQLQTGVLSALSAPPGRYPRIPPRQDVRPKAELHRVRALRCAHGSERHGCERRKRDACRPSDIHRPCSFFHPNDQHFCRNFYHERMRNE